MKNKKFILLVVVMIAVMFSLVACKNAESGKSDFGKNPSENLNPHQHVFDILADYISENAFTCVGGYYLLNEIDDSIFLDFIYMTEEQTIEINYANNSGVQKYNVSIWLEPTIDDEYDYVIKIKPNYISGELSASEFNRSTKLSHKSTNLYSNITEYKNLATKAIDQLLLRFNEFTAENDLGITAKDLGFDNYE